MALDMLMKIGDLKGESKIKGADGAMDVLAWSWGVSNSGTAHVGGGMGAGKANVQDLSFTKYLDTASPDLMLACCNGKHIGEAKLTLRKAAGDKQMEYLIITMTDLIVTSVSSGGSGGEDRLTENVTLNFAKVKVEYTEQTKTGSEAAKPKMTWNVEQGVSE